MTSKFTVEQIGHYILGADGGGENASIIVNGHEVAGGDKRVEAQVDLREGDTVVFDAQAFDVKRADESIEAPGLNL
jgi:hypothetical protein